MDIKDKMLEAIEQNTADNFHGDNDKVHKEEAAEDCAKIAEDFAIEFAKWMRESTSYAGNGFYIVFPEDVYKQVKLPELLQLFKQQK